MGVIIDQTIHGVKVRCDKMIFTIERQHLDIDMFYSILDENGSVLYNNHYNVVDPVIIQRRIMPDATQIQVLADVGIADILGLDLTTLISDYTDIQYFTNSELEVIRLANETQPEEEPPPPEPDDDPIIDDPLPDDTSTDDTSSP